MPRLFCILLFIVFVVRSLTFVHAQEGSTTVDHAGNLKTVVVATKSKSDSVIAVPPAISVMMDLRGDKHASSADSVDLLNWLSKEAALNGLQSTDLRPWHIVVTYDQFDEDGDNVHSGVYEEFWVGEKKYKRIYKSDNLNQTDYATDKGLYRLGDQRWPDRTQSQIRAEIVAPFYYAGTLEGFHARNAERTFSRYKLQCILIERNSGISDPTQYCFEPDGSTLRYSRGMGWFQTVYNGIVPFQGRSLAREVDVTNAGKPYLKLRVETIELISHLDEADFIPPTDSIGPLGGRISGVQLTETNSIFPQWPASLRGQHVTVTVEFVVGRDGHVVSAHGVSGPLEGYKACEDAVRQMTFQPYLVLDKPVEVEQKMSFHYN
ncbi:MAG: hypothetical protein WB949_04580 [Candidatus Acidiferrales bacterium]